MSENNKPVTIYDIAAEAGVTAMTVSRVFAGGSVSNKTKEKVLRIANKYNYSVNGLARSLKNSRTMQILLATPWVREFFNFNLISSAQACAQKNGYSLFLSYTYDTEEGINNVIQQMMSGMADGLILMTSDIDEDLLQKLSVITRPVILSVVAPYNGEPLPYDYVGADTFHGIYMSTKFFIHEGHKSICYIGMNDQQLEGKKRLQGFKCAMDDSNVPIQPWFVFTGGNNDIFGYQTGLVLSRMKNPPTAIVAATDSIAMGVYKAFEESPLSISKDVSIIGMDDIDYDVYLTPHLASVALYPEKIGEAAITHLINRLNGDSSPAKTIAIEPHLIIRQSALRI